MNMTESDRMVAHMIHRQQQETAVKINDILLRYKPQLSPEFYDAAKELVSDNLDFITKQDTKLMDEHQPICAVGESLVRSNRD